MIKLFNTEYVFSHDGLVYEKLSGCHHKYRVILSDDDYDYVEDEDLISELDRVWEER